MSDPFLEREKELMKLNESLNTKMTFGSKQPKAAATATAGNRMKKPIVKSFKCDQINHAKLCTTKATSKLKADNCEIIKKPISNAYVDSVAVQKFTAVEKKHELDAKDIGFNRNISNRTNGSGNGNSSHSSGDDTHTTCNGGIKQTTTTTMMGDGDGKGNGNGNNGGDDDDNKQQISNEHFDHALIESIEKAIGTKDVASSTTAAAATAATTAAHLSLIPSNVYRKNISTDGIIK